MYFRRLIIGLISFPLYIGVSASLLSHLNSDLKWMIYILGAIYLLIFGFWAFYHTRLLGMEWVEWIDTSVVSMENVTIPMADGWEMHGVILKSKNFSDNNSVPGIIIHHGLNASKEILYHLALPLALHGNIVLAIDARAHGESRKVFPSAKRDDWFRDENLGIFPDFTRIVDWFIKYPNINPAKISAIGHSMGATVCLTKGLVDPRIQLCIGIAPIYSFEDLIASQHAYGRFSEFWWSVGVLRLSINFKKCLAVQSKISPRDYFKQISLENAQSKVRIIQCKDDHIVTYRENAQQIIRDLSLPEDAKLITDKGDHSFRGQETLIIERILHWLDEKDLSV